MTIWHFICAFIYKDISLQKILEDTNTDQLEIAVKRVMARKIKNFRKQLGLTQTEFAKKCQINRSTLANIESESAQISIKMLIQIAHFLNIDYNELMPLQSEIMHEQESLKTKNTEVKLSQMLLENNLSQSYLSILLDKQ